MPHTEARGFNPRRLLSSFKGVHPPSRIWGSIEPGDEERMAKGEPVSEPTWTSVRHWVISTFTAHCPSLPANWFNEGAPPQGCIYMATLPAGAFKEKAGYIKIVIGRDARGRSRLEYAHRLVAWAWASKEPGLAWENDRKGCVVMHTCDHPECVSPRCLRVGTQSENTKAGKRRRL